MVQIPSYICLHIATQTFQIRPLPIDPAINCQRALGMFGKSLGGMSRELMVRALHFPTRLALEGQIAAKG